MTHFRQAVFFWVFAAAVIGMAACRPEAEEPEPDLKATIEALESRAVEAAPPTPDLTAPQDPGLQATIEALEARIQQAAPAPANTPVPPQPDLATTIEALEAHLQQGPGIQEPMEGTPGPTATPATMDTAKNPSGDAILNDPVWRGNAEVVKLLLDAGADPNALDADDSPILIEAAWRNHKDVVRALIEAGADPLAAAPDGTTAVSEAAWRGHTEVLEILTSGN